MSGNKYIKKLKFYKNFRDDNHCLQAALMMVLNTVNRASWDEVNRMTQYEENLYSWTPAAVVGLAGRIPGSRLISGIDYGQFAERGEEYLKESMGQQWFELQQEHASPEFQKEQIAAKRLVEKGLTERKIIQKGDIEELLKRHLLIALVDAGKLTDQDWSSGHFVVIHDHDEESFYINDPGLPPRKNWRVDKEKLIEAFKDELIIVPWPNKKSEDHRTIDRMIAT